MQDESMLEVCQHGPENTMTAKAQANTILFEFVTGVVESVVGPRVTNEPKEVIKHQTCTLDLALKTSWGSSALTSVLILDMSVLILEINNYFDPPALTMRHGHLRRPCREGGVQSLKMTPMRQSAAFHFV